MFIRKAKGRFKILSHPLQKIGTGAKHCLSTCGKQFFLVQVIFILLYRLFLDIWYMAVLSPFYDYVGFSFGGLSLTYLLSWLLLVILSPFIAHLLNFSNASSLLVSLLNLLYFIPLTSYYGCSNVDLRLFIIAAVYWALLLTAQLYIPVLQLPPPSHQKGRTIVITLFTLFLCSFSLYLFVRYADGQFLFSITDVYDVRTAAYEYPLPRILSYLYSMTPSMLGCLLLFWLNRKKYFISGIICVSFLFIFSFAGKKSFLFYFFLVIVCYFFFREWMVKWLPGFFTLVPCAAILEKVIVGSNFITSLFLRRMMYIPVRLGTIYYEFFQTNPLNLARAGIMRYLSFKSLYSTTIPLIIGEYENSPNNNENTGLLGDLFANYPTLLGLLLLPPFLILIFRYFDALTSVQKAAFLFPTAFLFAYSFMSGTWSVTLLSNGFLFICPLLYILQTKKDTSRL